MVESKSTYPEIIALNHIYNQHNVEVQILTTECLADKKDYQAITFKVGDETFEMFVDDEYDDFQYNYPLLNLCIVLRELEFYNNTQDYLLWCSELYLNSSDNKVLAYYRELGRIYREIESIIGKIDSQISDWDFEMSSGAAYELRKKV